MGMRREDGRRGTSRDRQRTRFAARDVEMGVAAASAIAREARSPSFGGGVESANGGFGAGAIRALVGATRADASCQVGRMSSLVAVEDLDEFVAAPVGRCLVGSTFAVWCAAPDLAGSIQWSVIDAQAVREILLALDFLDHPGLAARGRIFMDCGEVERVDAEAIVDYTVVARVKLPAWSARLVRQVIVVPDGLVGILLSGVLPLLMPSHPFRFVRDAAEGHRWLGDARSVAAHQQASEIVVARRGEAVFTRRLRVELARDTANANVDDCAAALGLSPRTLQRYLHKLGTSFRAELGRARLSTATELLGLSDLKIDAIANRLGFGTSTRLSAFLRRQVKLSARELRAARRA